VPWTVLTGCITPEGLRASAEAYRRLGGGAIWVFDTLGATRYTRPAIGCALDIAERASREHGLRVAIVGVRPASALSMGLAVLRLRGHLFEQPVEYLGAASEDEMLAEVRWWQAKLAGGDGR
jgi:hypothetical protein